MSRGSMGEEPVQLVGVDWSGAASPRAAARAIWIAVVREGVLVELGNGRDRDQTLGHVSALARAERRTVVGLDFAFSLPRWYLGRRGLSAAGLWERAAARAVNGRIWSPDAARP